MAASRSSAAITGATIAGSRRALATRSSPTCPCSHSQSNDCGPRTTPSAAAACANAALGSSLATREVSPTRTRERVRVGCPIALVVTVPLNTMLADVDETLRSLLKRELERHGFDGVEIAFDAPAREWSGQLSSPTVNLFLYALRESQEGGRTSGSTTGRRTATRARSGRRCSWSARTR